MVLSGAGMMIGNTECTPGYYNNEGQAFTEVQRKSAGHPAGAMAFFQHIRQWRDTGEFQGIEFK